MSQNVRSGSKRPRNPGPVSNVLQKTSFDTYTKSLLHFNGSDGSVTITDEIGLVWTASGNAQIDTAKSRFGGSAVLFDGTTDYVETPDSDDFHLAADSWTYDFWVNFNSVSGTQYFVTQYNGPSDEGFGMQFDGASTTLNCWQWESAAYIWNFYCTFAPVTNYWYHIAVIRDGNTPRIFINGVSQTVTQQTSISGKTAKNVSAVLRVGAYHNATNAVNGWLDEFRFSKGIARWSANFVPPAYEYGATSRLDDAFTKALLHLNGPDGSRGFFDEAGTIWTPYGDSQLDIAQSKFGGAALLLDGSGDFILPSTSLSLPEFAFGTGDFTVDFWIRGNALPTAGLSSILYDSRTTSPPAGSYYPVIYVSNGGGGPVIVFFANGVNHIAGTTVLSNNVWYHVALARSSGSTKLYLNGTQEGSTYTDANNYVNGTWRPMIGASGDVDGTSSLFNGWIDELRISKGIARWTSNFTPPTAEY